MGVPAWADQTSHVKNLQIQSGTHCVVLDTVVQDDLKRNVPHREFTRRGKKEGEQLTGIVSLVGVRLSLLVSCGLLLLILRLGALVIGLHASGTRHICGMFCLRLKVEGGELGIKGKWGL